MTADAMKCKKCRFMLLSDCSRVLINAHGEKNAQTSTDSECSSIEEQTLLYAHEECLPKWVSDLIAAENWLKGKLSCPNCQSRVGAFNFTSGLKCDCEMGVIPPVHFVKSKVDFVVKQSSSI